MKAHFRFIGNNKMKADFCFIESAEPCRVPLQPGVEHVMHNNPSSLFNRALADSEAGSD
jgi:hypothetical protein